MPAEPPRSTQAADTARRVVERIDGRPGGPTLIIVGGIHGNEPAGLIAARRVFAELGRGLRVSGRVALVAGNLQALRLRQRFVAEDLNRRWIPARLLALDEETDPGRGGAERSEQAELLRTFAELLAGATAPFHFIDLHTSSADGPPFLTVGDTLANRRFVREFPLPKILGLEEQVEGALLEYLSDAGFVTVGVEAGRHDSPAAVDRMEAALWLALVRGRFVRRVEVAGLAGYRAVLREASHGVPRVIEVIDRHEIHERDSFRMEPGFVNFQRIAAGELLATDRNGSVRAAFGGRILLPLYQGKGNDGFFIAREVAPAFLAVSAALRILRLDGLLRLLPGVRRDPREADRLRIDTRIARWRAQVLLRLFGYRKVMTAGSELVVSRRRYHRFPPNTAPELRPPSAR